MGDSTYYVPKSQKGIFANGAAWIVAVIVLAMLIGGAVFAVKTLTASPAGKAGAYRVKESTQNRLFAQANFAQLSADVDGYVGKIAIAKAAIAAAKATADTTDDGLRAVDLIGIRQACVDAVQQYNADSQKYALRDFKSAGLSPRRYIEECK